MNREQTQAVLQVIAGAVLAVLVAGASLWGLGQMGDQGQQAEPMFGAQALAGGDATNFSAVEVDANSSTVEGLDVDQTGTGDIAVFRDGGTAVWTLADGGTVTTAGGFDLNGNTLTWDVDADTTAVASFDDVITYTLGAATGRVDILTGNLKVGNGTPTLTQNGEDGYIEGTFEVDGQSQFDGGLDLNGSTLTIDADTDTTLVSSFDDVITITLGAATGRVDLLTGNLKVGNGTPGTAQNGEDAYVEGVLEVDGTSDLDGTVDAAADVDIGTFLNLSARSAISLTEGAIITPTGTLQPLTSFGAITTSTTVPIAVTGFEAGDLLILRNDNASDVIKIDGTGGTVECKADISLGTKDTVTLILDTSAWHCLANYDNS